MVPSRGKDCQAQLLETDFISGCGAPSPSVARFRRRRSRSMSAALAWTARFGLGKSVRAGRDRLYDQIHDPQVLADAWKRVRSGRSPGVDGMTPAAFEADWPRNMADLAEA